MMTKYPSVYVPLVGEDGNAFMILGRVDRALREAGVDKAERDAYQAEATSGDYGHLLRTTMEWVNIDNPDDDQYGDDDDVEY